MQTFDEILEETAGDFLIEDFAPEQITYIRQSSTLNLMALATIGALTGLPAAMATIGIGLAQWDLTERQITALVNRQPVDDLGDAPVGTAPRLIVNIRNDATYGISSSEIDLGRDKVLVPVRLGEAAQKRKLSKILSQDAGMMVVELR